MLTEAGHEAGLPTITEITDPRQLEDLERRARRGEKITL